MAGAAQFLFVGVVVAAPRLRQQAGCRPPVGGPTCRGEATSRQQIAQVRPPTAVPAKATRREERRALKAVRGEASLVHGNEARLRDLLHEFGCEPVCLQSGVLGEGFLGCRVCVIRKILNQNEQSERRFKITSRQRNRK